MFYQRSRTSMKWGHNCFFINLSFTLLHLLLADSSLSSSSNSISETSLSSSPSSGKYLAIYDFTRHVACGMWHVAYSYDMQSRDSSCCGQYIQLVYLNSHIEYICQYHSNFWIDWRTGAWTVNIELYYHRHCPEALECCHQKCNILPFIFNNIFVINLDSFWSCFSNSLPNSYSSSSADSHRLIGYFAL